MARLRLAAGCGFLLLPCKNNPHTARPSTQHHHGYADRSSWDLDTFQLGTHTLGATRSCLLRAPSSFSGGHRGWLSLACISMMALQKALEGLGQRWPRRAITSFQNLQKTKSALGEYAFGFPLLSRRGYAALRGGLCLSWHPCLPHPRI